MTTVSRPTKYQEGQIYGSFVDTDEFILAENTEAGRVVAKTDSALKVRKFTNNIATVTFSADLVTSNKINLKVTNSSGVLTSIAEVTFATDHVTTMGAIGTAITAVNSDLTCTVGGGSNRVLTVRMAEGTVLAIESVLVTAGASQATATVANSSDEAVAGITVKEGYEQDSSGYVYAKSGDPAKVLRKGRIGISFKCSSKFLDICYTCHAYWFLAFTIRSSFFKYANLYAFPIKLF